MWCSHEWCNSEDPRWRAHFWKGRRSKSIYSISELCCRGIIGLWCTCTLVVFTEYCVHARNNANNQWDIPLFYPVFFLSTKSYFQCFGTLCACEVLYTEVDWPAWHAVQANKIFSWTLLCIFTWLYVAVVPQPNTNADLTKTFVLANSSLCAGCNTDFYTLGKPFSFSHPCLIMKQWCST